MSIAQQNLTNAGRNILGRANAGEPLVISTVVVGDGPASQPSDVWPLNALIGLKNVCPIVQKRDLGEGVLIVEGLLSHKQILSAFELREVGVMARIGNEPDRLYCVANCFLEPPDTVSPSPTATSAFKIKILIDRATDVTIMIGSSSDILADNIGTDAIGPGLFSDKILNILRFKRLIEGQNIELEDGPETVKINAKGGVEIIEQDLTLYVFKNPNPNNPLTEFPDLRAALLRAQTLQCPPNRFITIQHGVGVWTYNTPVVIYHPQGRQIRIRGAVPNKLISTGNISAATPPGTSFNLRRNITFAAADAALINETDGLTLFSRSNSNAGIQWACASPCDGRTGNNAVFLNHAWPTNGITPGNSGAYSVMRYPTVLNFTSSSGLIIRGCSLGLLEDLFIQGPRTPINQVVNYRGIEAEVNSSVKLGLHIAVYGFGIGLAALSPGSFIDGERTFVSGQNPNAANYYYGGAYAENGGHINLLYAQLTGSNGSCAGAHDMARIGLYRCYLLGAIHEGVLVSDADGNVSESQIFWNGDVGVYASFGSRVIAQNASVEDNDYYDYYADNHSFIDLNGSSSGSVFPTRNTNNANSGFSVVLGAFGPGAPAIPQETPWP